MKRRFILYVFIGSWFVLCLANVQKLDVAVLFQCFDDLYCIITLICAVDLCLPKSLSNRTDLLTVFSLLLSQSKPCVIRLFLCHTTVSHIVNDVLYKVLSMSAVVWFQLSVLLIRH